MWADHWPPAAPPWSQKGRRVQLAQSGRRATHTARPWSTMRWQKSLLSSGGMHWRSCISTFRGSRLPSVMPKSHVMRMQWVSQT